MLLVMLQVNDFQSPVLNLIGTIFMLFRLSLLPLKWIGFGEHLYYMPGQTLASRLLISPPLSIPDNQIYVNFKMHPNVAKMRKKGLQSDTSKTSVIKQRLLHMRLVISRGFHPSEPYLNMRYC